MTNRRETPEEQIVPVEQEIDRERREEIDPEIIIEGPGNLEEQFEIDYQRDHPKPRPS